MFRDFFDPDRNWKSWDKLTHLLGSLVVCAIATLHFRWLDAALITVALGIALELGQWQTAHNENVYYDAPGSRGLDEVVRPLGHVGFGFGLLDLAADIVGALLWVAIITVATLF